MIQQKHTTCDRTSTRLSSNRTDGGNVGSSAKSANDHHAARGGYYRRNTNVISDGGGSHTVLGYYNYDNLHNSDNVMFDVKQEEDEDDGLMANELYRSIVPRFVLLNLVPSEKGHQQSEWRTVGNVTYGHATVNTIQYIGADQIPEYITLEAQQSDDIRRQFENLLKRRPLVNRSHSGKHRFRVATNIAPPFVIESTKLDNNTCLIGDFCLKVTFPFPRF